MAVMVKDQGHRAWIVREGWAPVAGERELGCQEEPDQVTGVVDQPAAVAPC